MSSVSIPELLVLLVRHGCPDVGRHEGLLLLLAMVVAFLIRPDVIEEQSNGGDGATDLGAHDGQLSRAEVGGILGLKGLGAYNVAEGKGATDEGRGKGALGTSSTIGDGPLRLAMSAL